MGMLLMAAGASAAELATAPQPTSAQKSPAVVDLAAEANRLLRETALALQSRSIEPAELPKDFLCPNCSIIVENLRADEQASASAYPRMFYPGVFQTAKAERLPLSPQQDLRNIDFRLPPRLAESIVKGRVLRTDGTPAAGAQVSYRDVTYEDLKTFEYGVRTNMQGEFSFKAYRGGRYLVEADYSSRDPRQRSGRAEPITVVVTKPEESITLIINRSAQ